MKIYKTESEAIAAYYDYIKNHIDLVSKAFDRYGKSICKDIVRTDNSYAILYDKLYVRVLDHDKSKYDSAEFNGYRMKFFPCVEDNIEENKKFIDNAFNSAWTHHYFHNDHHSQFWKTEVHGKDVKTEMSKAAIAEMLLDWIAMSMNFKSSVYDWWMNEADEERSFMNQNTINLVNYIVNKNKYEWDFSE